MNSEAALNVNIESGRPGKGDPKWRSINEKFILEHKARHCTVVTYNSLNLLYVCEVLYVENINDSRRLFSTVAG